MRSFEPTASSEAIAAPLGGEAVRVVKGLDDLTDIVGAGDGSVFLSLVSTEEGVPRPFVRADLIEGAVPTTVFEGSSIKPEGAQVLEYDNKLFASVVATFSNGKARMVMDLASPGEPEDALACLPWEAVSSDANPDASRVRMDADFVYARVDGDLEHSGIIRVPRSSSR